MHFRELSNEVHGTQTPKKEVVSKQKWIPSQINFGKGYILPGSFPGDSVVKNLPANTGDSGLILVWEDPLEKEMAAHSSNLAWKISWTEEPSGLQSMGTTEQLTLNTLIFWS